MHALSALLVFALASALPLAAQAQAHEHSTPAATAEAPTAGYLATQNALRDLWVEHVFWARNYVLARAGHDDARAGVAAGQVVANAKAIAGAIVPFYGQEAGDQLLELLAGHWGAVKAYADAHLAGDEAGAQKATQQLTANAGQIAGFLSGANPYLPKDTLVGLLSAHGAHHVQQTRQIAAGDFAAEAETWSAMRGHMFVIADALAGALAKQFPDKVG